MLFGLLSKMLEWIGLGDRMGGQTLMTTKALVVLKNTNKFSPSVRFWFIFFNQTRPQHPCDKDYETCQAWADATSVQVKIFFLEGGETYTSHRQSQVFLNVTQLYIRYRTKLKKILQIHFVYTWFVLVTGNAYLIFVISFTQTGFSKTKFYTKKNE